MRNPKSRHWARQIPEGLVIAMGLAWSLVLGVPVARKLHGYFPDANKWTLVIVGTGAVFLLLVLLVVALHWWWARDTEKR